jgi:four helix bundle protein
MTPQELRSRTKDFALGVIRFYTRLPHTEEARVIGRQLLRAGTAVGAHDRATCRPRSRADFIAKLGLTIEEVDETSYWLEILVDGGLVTARAAADLHREADELTRIFVRSRATARNNARRTQNEITNH